MRDRRQQRLLLLAVRYARASTLRVRMPKSNGILLLYRSHACARYAYAFECIRLSLRVACHKYICIYILHFTRCLNCNMQKKAEQV